MSAGEAPDSITAGEEAHKHLRGSSLLLLGRLLSLGLNFATQIMVVHYLSKHDYGALSHAVSAMAFAGALLTLGLPGCLSRVVPLYHERGELDRVTGALFLAAAATLAASLAFLAAAWLQPGWVLHVTGGSAEATRLVLILFAALPLEILERLLIAMFASFGHAGPIFFRRHVLAPAFGLGVVGLCILLRAPVTLLAASYVATSAVGLTINAVVLARVLRREGARLQLRMDRLRPVASELAKFAAPLLISEVVLTSMQTVSTLLLGYYRDSTEVAQFRVILPAANLNTLVMSSFMMLYTPALARMSAKGDFLRINRLYWTTAVWLAVLSFPIFAITFSLAHPVTSLLYGERYAGSSLYLQILAVAYYVNVMLGFNSLTLKVLGRLRLTSLIDGLALACNVGSAVLLIPRYGPVGAAAATAIGMIVHNLLCQAALRSVQGVDVLERRHLSFYAVVVSTAIALLAFQRLTNAGVVLSTLLTICASALVLHFAIPRMAVAAVFPGLLRLPLLGRYLGSPDSNEAVEPILPDDGMTDAEPQTPFHGAGESRCLR